MVSYEFSNTIFALLPPVLAIILAITTRQVLLSLGVGIIVGVMMLSGFAPMDALSNLFDRVIGLIWDTQANSYESWNVPLLGFLLLLGIMTTVISASGAAKAFANWARGRIKTGKDAQLMTMLLGIIIFIDDYFNTLVVGAVARPVTDQHGVSREKLAYTVDSTAAPICVITPISSWGAYIIGLLGVLLAERGISEVTGLSAFAQIVPMNLYPLVALAFLLCVICFKLDFGPMARAEARAKAGQPWDQSKGIPPGTDTQLAEAENGSMWGLLTPILILIISAVYFMVSEGADALRADEKVFSIIGAFENTDVAKALFQAAMLGVVTSILMSLKQKLPLLSITKAIRSGVRSMLPAVYILLFAWTISGVIGDLETGAYMASLIEGSLPVWLLPVLIFLLAAATAFATGTSWGTFAIMLPIGADIAMAAEATMILPMMAAVLAGAVFGDHCSPISDTTILSSTGAGCHHIDHVTTQLPYALICAVISMLGFVALGLTGSTLMALVVSTLSLMIAVLILKRQIQTR